MTSPGSRLLVLLAIISSAIRGLSDRPVLGSPTKGIGSRTSEGQRKALTRTKEPRLTCPFKAEESSRTNSFLWTVNGRRRPSFFFGTIHVPYSLVWSHIPSNAKAAFRRSDDLHLELDLLDPETIAALYRCQLLPHGKSLVDVIPRSLYFRLKRHLRYVRRSMPRWLTPAQRGRGIVADYLFDALTGNWERRRPIYVMMMINSLTEADVRLRGIPVLDLYLAQEARRMKKKRGAVERVEEHCLPLNELNLSQAIFILNRTLWHHELHRFDPSSSSSADFLSSSPLRPRAPPSRSSSSSSSSSVVTSDDLVHHYNCGDLNALLFARDSVQFPNLAHESSGGSPPPPPPHASSVDRSGSAEEEEEEEETARQIDEYFREKLIFKRNEKMAERVDRLLTIHPKTSFFFAFGAGHFIGNNSVIEILQRRGYNISHTPPTRSPSPENRGKHKSERRKTGDRRWLQSISDRSETDSLQLKRSQFNDLWIRHDNNRFKFGDFVHQQHIHDTSPVMSMTASRSPWSVVMSSTSSLSSLVTTAVGVIMFSLSTVVVFTAET